MTGPRRKINFSLATKKTIIKKDVKLIEVKTPRIKFGIWVMTKEIHVWCPSTKPTVLTKIEEKVHTDVLIEDVHVYC